MAITNVLYIDGVLLPTPSSITPQLERLWSQGSGRTASGEFVGDIQAEKWRIDVTWKPVSEDNAQKLMSALFSKAFVEVKFYSPLHKSFKTITAYAGGTKTPVYSYALNDVMYEELSVSLVEK